MQALVSKGTEKGRSPYTERVCKDPGIREGRGPEGPQPISYHLALLWSWVLILAGCATEL